MILDYYEEALKEFEKDMDPNNPDHPHFGI